MHLFKSAYFQNKALFLHRFYRTTLFSTQTGLNQNDYFLSVFGSDGDAKAFLLLFFLTIPVSTKLPARIPNIMFFIFTLDGTVADYNYYITTATAPPCIYSL